MAAFNTYVVKIDNLKSIKITPEKIILKGAAITTAKIETIKEKRTDSVYGRPAKNITIKTFDGYFEIHPYFKGSNPLATGGHSKKI